MEKSHNRTPAPPAMENPGSNSVLHQPEDSSTGHPPPYFPHRLVHKHSSTSSAVTRAQQQFSRHRHRATPHDVVRHRWLWVQRCLLVAALGTAAGLVGWAAYQRLADAEHDVAAAQLETTAERALTAAVAATARNVQGLQTATLLFASAFPRPAQWPFVALPNYNVVISNLLQAVNGRGMVFHPMVKAAGPDLTPTSDPVAWAASEQGRFEDFAYRYYNATYGPDIAGQHGFGTGVFAFGDQTAQDGKYHDTTGVTRATPSPHTFLTPVLQDVGPQPFNLLMLNLHAIESRTWDIDEMVACAARRADEIKQHPDAPPRECRTLQHVENLFGQTVEAGPGGVVFQPIYPGYALYGSEPFDDFTQLDVGGNASGDASDNSNSPMGDGTQMTGFMISLILWRDVLESLFDNQVSGITCVLRVREYLPPPPPHPGVNDTNSSSSSSNNTTNYVTHTYTYTITNGVASYVGQPGDFQDEEYCDLGQTMDLAITENTTDANTMEQGGSGGPPVMSVTSDTYTLTVCASKEYYKAYETDNPHTSMMGAVLIILGTSLFFFAYDCFVRREFGYADRVLEAKRAFMRFVSHEVRTPLNTVCMGLRLLEEELTNGLSDATATSSSNSRAEAEVQKSTAISSTTPLSSISEASIVGSDSTFDSLSPQENPIVKETTSSNANDLITLSRQIRSSAESAVDILNDLLQYDKIENGTLKLELTIIPIWNLLCRTMSEFNLPAVKKGIRLTLDLSSLVTAPEEGSSNVQAPVADPQCPEHLSREVREQRVIGDTVRLTQVFRNLISNALKFTKQHGSISVQLAWKRPEKSPTEYPAREFKLNNCKERVSLHPNGHIEVSVTDTGAGMTTDQLQKLFGNGVQFNVNELQAGKGSGLGLFISKGIVDQHDGKLTAASDGLDCGSTFTATLPLYHVPDEVLPSGLAHLRILQEETVAEATKDEAASAPSTSQDQQSPSESLHILIVDDANLNRRLLSRLLSKRGHVCEEAEDGDVAIEKVSQSLASGQSYDTILLDYEMPRCNGPTAVQEIRRLGCDSFVVGITGNVLPDDVAHFKRCGANAVFPKPLELPLLEALWIEYGVLRASRSAIPRIETPVGLGDQAV